MFSGLQWGSVALSLFGCETPVEAPEPLPDAPFNFLVVLTDDIGMDYTSSYGGRVETPNIDALGDQGIRFTRAYSNPNCSPSRASLLTGKHASRTGLGRWLFVERGADGLRDHEITLPELLRDSPFAYTSAAVGKWHLNTYENADYLRSPLDMGGFDYFAGPLANPLEASVRREEDDPRRGFYNWEKVTNGVPSWESTYLVTDNANEAIGQLQTLPEPWFLWLAFSGAHSPWHIPPDDLHNVEGLTESSPDSDKMAAMVQATDRELGRVMAAMTDEQRERTIIIYAADNGTERPVIVPPWDPQRSKGSPFDGGVNVPFSVTGPIVAEPGTTNDALLHFVDVFSVIAQLAAVGVAHEIDGQSFLRQLTGNPEDSGTRDWVFTEAFWPNGPGLPHDGQTGWARRMVRDADYKYTRIVTEGELSEGLYHYDDPDRIGEGPNLLENPLDPAAEAALSQLKTLMDDKLAEM